MRYTTSLSVHNVTVSRGEKTILHDISFDIGPGDAIILKGSNGVGKTTLLKSLAGLISTETGDVCYSGLSGDGNKDEQGAACYCGPTNAIKLALTVNENLRFWTDLYSKSRDMAEEAKARLKLDAYAEYPAGSLSTGYARRLGLARLLIVDRPIWLIDEPTATLDHVAASDFERFVETHREMGGAVIIATHDAITLDRARNMTLALEENAS